MPHPAAGRFKILDGFKGLCRGLSMIERLAEIATLQGAANLGQQLQMDPRAAGR